MRHLFLAALLLMPIAARSADTDTTTLRVFIFAGQSNMVGTHSRVTDINRFPPFAGLDQPQKNVLFSYKLGREGMETSEGWIPMQPTHDYFGPELSFAKKVSQSIEAPIAVIKVASGGTTLGKDWNPDMPDGFKLYPLALEHVRASLAELERKKIAYRIEGFVWHQGENDMFDKAFKSAYAANLKNFIACWRRDLKLPNLRFYLGELCTKTIWGMDNRDNMLAIRTAQKAVADADPLVDYVPTSHDAVEISKDTSLHYHYGTLGQLEHGVNHADAYLRTLGIETGRDRSLKAWPYAKGSAVKLFILAGHRNMEGERAFQQELGTAAGDDSQIAFKYSLGGGFKTSKGWEPLGPAGAYDTFGPELSFAKTLRATEKGNIAIAKFTHSGTQMNDWTPEGKTLWSGLKELFPVKPAEQQPPVADVKARILYAQALNAAGSMERGTLTSPADGDIGSILGVGFPPFLGGPFVMMDEIGIANFVKEADRLADLYGEHLRPNALLKDMAAKGETFYGKNARKMTA